MDMIAAFFLKLFTGLHLAGIGTFFASALFLDFAVLGALRYIPPDQATKLSKVVEPRFFLVSSIALGVIALTGALQVLLLSFGPVARTFNGNLLAASTGFWLVLAASQVYYLTLRPQLPQAFPFDVFRDAQAGESVEARRATLIARMVLRAQAIACMLAVVVIGGAVRFGGV